MFIFVSFNADGAISLDQIFQEQMHSVNYSFKYIFFLENMDS